MENLSRFITLLVGTVPSFASHSVCAAKRKYGGPAHRSYTYLHSRTRAAYSPKPLSQ
jgi:hypothetical protein